MTAQDLTAAEPLRLPVRVFQSIRTRLILLFGLAFSDRFLATVELVNFFGIPGTSLVGVAGQHYAEAKRSLTLIADLKEERLRSWWTSGAWTLKC